MVDQGTYLFGYFSVVWAGIVVAVGYYHTDVYLAGRITPAQDRVISEKYGDLLGSGLPLVWAICFLVLWIRSRRTSVKST
jgi:hypothetical protein